MFGKLFSWTAVSSVMALAALSVTCLASDESEPKACHLPGDLVFVLDESGSIWGPAFQQQLEFVGLVADTFDISPDHTHIGVMTFASDTNIVFNLDQYDNRNDVKDAIRSITQRRGGTQTHKALADMRQLMFSPEHSRTSAAHVAIVITDGESEEPDQTKLQAELAHNEGIHVIAIGVGPHIIVDELKAIASSDDLVFTAPTYAALQPLRHKLAWKACEVRTTTAAPTTTTPAPLQMIDGCSSDTQVDILWTLPNEAGPADVDAALQLIATVAQDLKFGPTFVQVGVAPKVCSNERPAIRLRDHDTIDGFITALEGRRVPNTSNIDKQLEYLRTQGFADRNGGRPDAVKVAVIIVDRRAANPDAVKRELGKVRKAGVKLLVIGVGSDVDASELTTLASSSGSVIRANSFAELESIQVNLVQQLCTVIKEHNSSRSRRFYLRDLLDYNVE